MISRSVLNAGRSRHRVVAGCVDVAPRCLPIISRGSRPFSQSAPSRRKAEKIPARPANRRHAPTHRGKLPDYVPHLPETLEFFREDQATMEPAMIPILEKLKGIVKPTPADVHRIYCAFHEAAKQACKDGGPSTWEKDFIDAQGITPAELFVVARVLVGAIKGAQKIPLYLVMTDAAAALGEVDATIALGLWIARHNEALTDKNHFPRAIPRIIELALRENNPSPDALAVLGRIRSLGRNVKAEAVELLRQALKVGAARGGFELEAYCIARLGNVLCEMGRHVEACEVLEGGIKHDTAEICFELARALGMRGPRALELMTRAAVSGHPDAPAFLYEYTVRMLENGEGDPKKLMADAIEWGNIGKSYNPAARGEADRYF